MPRKAQQEVTPIHARREVPDELLVDLFKKMLNVYYLEERIKTFVRAGKVSFHASSRGHEKLQIAISYLLKAGRDWFFPYYREKALMVGLGMSNKDIFLHMLSKAEDPCGGGRNMSEHFSSRELHVVSSSACTGTQYLPAVGLARAIKMAGGDEIVYVSSGEGATSEGEFFEALNWAVREQLPVMFVVQNNGYAISVPQEVQTGSDVEDISRGFHMRAIQLDGTRFTAMYNSLAALVAEMRAHGGPRLIEAHVVRLESHSSSDDQTKYRSQEELDAVRLKDPLAHTAGVLMQKGIFEEGDILKLHEEVKAEVEKAALEADGSPDPRPETAVLNILSGTQPVTEEKPPASTSETVTMVEAINHGLHEEMERDPKIIMWGEDVADPKGGVFGATRGLGTSFPGRVMNSPLAEASIVGVAQGLAIGGHRPVVEIQFGDYSFPGYMQMRNEISTLRWRSGGAWSCPMVIRIAVGGYIRGGPFHSQCIEALYAHTPGWCIAYPSNASDAKGLIKTACRMDDPVLFLEHKGLYRQVYSKSPEPDAGYLLPFGKARVAREGNDLTAVTWGSGVVRCLRAAEALAQEEGLSVEVIDLRTILPWDVESVLESVRKTGKAIVVHEAIMTGGFGGEIASRIASESFEYLDGPVQRVAAKDSFVPYAPKLEAYVLPSQEEVTEAIRALGKY